MYICVTLPVNMYKTLNNSNYLQFLHTVYAKNPDNMKVKLDKGNDLKCKVLHNSPCAVICHFIVYNYPFRL